MWLLQSSPQDSLTTVNDEELSCHADPPHFHSSTQRAGQIESLLFQAFLIPPPHTHNTYSTLPTHENKQSSLKPAGFTSAEGVMKLIIWELFCVWKTPGKCGLPFLSPCWDGGITENAISTRRDRKTRTLFHDWIFASWVIQYLVMDSASKNPFLIAFLEGCGHAGPMAVQSYTHMFLACLLTLRSEHYRSRQKGILKYLEAGV